MKNKENHICPSCNGYGFHAGNTPEPVQEECDYCEATGAVDCETLENYLHPQKIEVSLSDDEMPF